MVGVVLPHRLQHLSHDYQKENAALTQQDCQQEVRANEKFTSEGCPAAATTRQANKKQHAARTGLGITWTSR